MYQIAKLFGENLRHFREKSGKSQKELAEKCDLSSNYISNIERGQQFPSAETIEALAAELETKSFLLFQPRPGLYDNLDNYLKHYTLRIWEAREQVFKDLGLDSKDIEKPE